MQVCSNGYILLLESASSPVTPYSYNPQPINTLIGSPIVAPYWSDNNLLCSGPDNLVRYVESSDEPLLTVAKNLARDDQFDPTFVVEVEYDRVQAYTCPDGAVSVSSAGSSIS